jgi:hypothetical protein
MRYKNPAAFRTALADNLRNSHPDEDLSRLLKRAVMERFLARTAAALADKALLKGGYAMELRLERARATQDLDLSMRNLSATEVVEALRDAGELDLDDHLGFRVEETAATVPQGAPYGGDRLTVVPRLDGKSFMPFPLDVGVGDAVSGADLLRGGIDLTFAGLRPLEVLAVPVEVHLAEKLHALSLPRPEHSMNSRVKDLVDVMLFIKRELPSLPVLKTAVQATFERRGTHELPERIELPRAAWESQYRRFSIELDLSSFAGTVYAANERLHRLLLEMRD